MLLYPNLKPTKRQIEHCAHPKRNFKPNVPRRFRNRAREPHLPDTRNRESERGYHRTQSSYTRRQFTRHVPDIDVVLPRIIVSKYQMFQHHNGNVRAWPIPNDPKEVGERIVERVCSNNRQWYHTNNRVSFGNTKMDEDTYIAVATTEKTYRGTIIKAGMKV